MKLTCYYSGISWEAPGFAFVKTSSAAHPIMGADQKELQAMAGRWSRNELTKIESHLLFVALLKSTELVQFRTPCVMSEYSQGKVAQNMEELLRATVWIHAYADPKRFLPSYAITRETRQFSTIRYWLDAWGEAHKELKHLKRNDFKRLDRKERALETLILNPHKRTEEMAPQIADWAAIAGNFPEFTVINPFNSLPCKCADYWKYLIVKAARGPIIARDVQADLVEIQEHCLTNIDLGSLHSNALFSLLKAAIERNQNFLGLGVWEMTATNPANTYSIVEDARSEAEILNAIAAQAPEQEPIRSGYTNQLAFIRAMNAWRLKNANR
jgi:hypothetical protein